MSRTIKRGQIWWANLYPSFSRSVCKIRPVVILQTDLLNDMGYFSTIICPLKTNITRKASILRVHISKGEVGNEEASDILIDQIRAIDNTRLTAQIGMLSTQKLLKLGGNLKILLEL